MCVLCLKGKVKTLNGGRVGGRGEGRITTTYYYYYDDYSSASVKKYRYLIHHKRLGLSSTRRLVTVQQRTSSHL